MATKFSLDGLTENKSFVGVVAILVVLVVAAPYFSAEGFAVARNQQDFTATGVALPTFIQKGLSFELQATIANLGDVSGSAVKYSYEIRNNYNRLYYNEVETDVIAGQTKTIALPVNQEFGAGTYTLIIRADSDDVFTESNENNNIYTTTITIPYGV